MASDWTLNTDYYNKMTRNFTVTNHFKVAVAIHNVSLAQEAEEYFSLEHSFAPTILPAGKSKSLVILSLKEKIDQGPHTSLRFLWQKQKPSLIFAKTIYEPGSASSGQMVNRSRMAVVIQHGPDDLNLFRNYVAFSVPFEN